MTERSISSSGIGAISAGLARLMGAFLTSSRVLRTILLITSPFQPHCSSGRDDSHNLNRLLFFHRVCDDQNYAVSQHPNRLPSRLTFNESINLRKGKLIQKHPHSFLEIDAMLFAIDPCLDLVPFELL